MKLAAGYIVFDGLETLEASIRSIRESVDFVIVSYQTISWGNTSCQPTMIPTLQRLKEMRLIDELLEFKDFRPSSLTTASDVLQAKHFECLKRQSTLTKALELGATHYLSMDADEFYVKSQFESAKSLIISEKLDATAVKYINYVTPTLNQGYSRFKVPFIYRIGHGSRHTPSQFMFGEIDPTRGLHDESYIRSKVLDPELITMHHMEMVRLDLSLKYESSSRMFRDRKKIPVLVDDIQRAKSASVLKFTDMHFGDTQTGSKADIPLIECEDQFRVNDLLKQYQKVNCL